MFFEPVHCLLLPTNIVFLSLNRNRTAILVSELDLFTLITRSVLTAALYSNLFYIQLLHIQYYVFVAALNDGFSVSSYSNSI